MKKIFAFAAMALMVMGASAQVNFGVKGGLNLSKMTEMPGVEDDDVNRLAGFNAGIVAEYPVALGVGLRGELLFQTNGYKYETSIAGADFDYKMKTNYIAVPVLAEYALPVLDQRLSVYCGIQLGYCLGGKWESTTKAAGVTFDSDDTLDSDNYNAFDLGGVIGAEFMATDHIGVEARFVRGTMPFAKVDNGDDKGKNNNFSLGLVYKF